MLSRPDPLAHPPVEALLASPLAPGLREHLACCPKCRIELRLLQGSLAHEAEPPEPGPDLPAPGEEHDGLRILAWLGAGGFGDVLLVERLESGERLALKVAREGGAALRSRMRRELAVGQQIDHPNVLPTIDLVALGGRPALLLPYVPGCSLERLLGAARLEREEALALVDGVLAGLGAAHAAGVVHRDLKPGNILLDPRSGALVPVLADFGLAAAREASGSIRTRTGARLGTALWAAPEQLRDASRVDPRADLWSVGALIYTLLVGRVPFPQTDPVARHEAIAGRAAASLAAAAPGAPAALCALVEALLSLEPEDRPEDAAEVRRRLGADRPPVRGAALARVRAEARRVEEALPAAQGAAAGGTEPLVGREEALGALLDTLAPGARICLHGPGGVGKTALAGAALADPRLNRGAWPGGAWWVSARGCEDEAALVAAVARALGLRLPREQTAALAAALAGRDATLIALDELEGCAGAAALADGLAADAPEVALLCTSRTPTGAAAERVWTVPPLAPAQAAALFAARATRVRGGALVPEERAAVEPLVRHLDGLPLAIELAAARAAHLSPADLLRRLEAGQDLLRAPGRDDRHASLARVIAASWEPLDPSLARLCARASVFAGAFDLDAAEAVLDEPAAIAADLLDELVRRALLTSVPTEQGPRYSMLEPLRAYAEARLGPDREAARARHRDHVLRVGGALAERVWTWTRDADLRALAALLPELRTIHQRFEDPETVLRAALLGITATFWTAGGADFFRERALAARARLPDSALTRSLEAEAIRGREDFPAALRAAVRAWEPLTAARATVNGLSVLVWSGRTDALLEAAQEARDHRVFEDFPVLELRAAQLEAVAVGYQRGLEHAEPRMRDLVARIDGRAQASLGIQTHCLLVDMVQQRGGDAGALAWEGVRMARRAVDPLQRAIADALLGVHLCRAGQLGAGLDRLRQAEAGAVGAPRAQQKARLGLAEFLSGAEGEAVARRLADEAARGGQTATAALAGALAGLHALLDRRPAGLEAALQAAESAVVAPLALGWLRAARALLGEAPGAPDPRLPPGLAALLAALPVGLGEPEPRRVLALAAADVEPHLRFYAARLLALRDAREGTR